MKILVLSTTALVAGSAAFAGGVDPAPAPAPAPIAPLPVATTDWSGGYAGLSLGYAGADSEGSDILEDPDDDDDFLDVDIDGDGIVGGAFAGYQRDFGNFVLGAEADLNSSNLDFDDDDLGDLFDEDENDFDGGGEIDEIHRLKLRAGYDTGRALVYGVLGGAYASGEFFGDDVSDTGYVVGAGVDYLVTDNITAGAEVLYHQFDDFDDTDIDIDATTVQARVAYKF